jgi:hypothetical protein
MAIRSYLGIDEARARLEQALDGLDTSSPHTRLALMEGGELVVELPCDLTHALVEALGHLCRGRPVTLTPRHARLTPGEVAGALGCSRAHVVGLVRSGRLPLDRSCAPPRVLAADLEALERRDHDERARALAEYTASSRALSEEDG